MDFNEWRNMGFVVHQLLEKEGSGERNELLKQSKNRLMDGGGINMPSI